MGDGRLLREADGEIYDIRLSKSLEVYLVWQSPR
jgi:hypothetical protein